MAKGGLLRIKVIGDADSVKKAMKETEGALGGLTGKVGKLAGALLAVGAIKEFGDFLSESASAAMEDAKAQEVLHTAVKNVTGATAAELTALDSYITKTQAATGFTEEELRPAMVKLTAATKDISQAQQILAVAMDVSTARGVSLETITLALEKAQNGQVTSLQRLGVQTKDAAGETLEFDELLQQLGETYGGATAAAADSFAGKMERTKLIFGEIKESVGMAMLPALEKLATVLVDNMPTFESLGKTFGEVVATGLDLVSKTALPLLQEVFETVWPIAQGLVQDFIDWFKSPNGQLFISKLIDTIGGTLNTLKETFGTVWTAVRPFVEDFIDWFDSDRGQWLIQGLLRDINNVVRDVLTAFTEVFTALAPLLGPIITTVIRILQPLVTILHEIIADLTSIPERLSKIPGFNGQAAGNTPYMVIPNDVRNATRGSPIVAQGSMLSGGFTMSADELGAAAFTSTNALGQTVSGWYGSNGWATSVMHNQGDYSEDEIRTAAAIYNAQLAYWNGWKNNPMFSDTPIGTGGQASGSMAAGATGQMNAYTDKGGVDRYKNVTINVTGNTGVEIGRAIVSALATV